MMMVNQEKPNITVVLFRISRIFGKIGGMSLSDMQFGTKRKLA